MACRPAVLLVFAAVVMAAATPTSGSTHTRSLSGASRTQSLSASVSTSTTTSSSNCCSTNSSSPKTSWSHSDAMTSTRSISHSTVQSNSAESYTLESSSTRYSPTRSRTPLSRSVSIVSRGAPTGTLSKGTQSPPRSITLTLPSPTRVLTPTHSDIEFQDAFVQVSLSPDPMATETFDTGQQFINFTALPLGTVAWADELIPFVLQSMAGSQAWNPFGFDQRKESIFRSASTLVSQLPAGSAPVPSSVAGVANVLHVVFDSDPCYDCRTDEIISFDATPFLRSINSFVVIPGAAAAGGSSSSALVISWTVQEDRHHDSRRVAGLVLSVGMCAYLAVNSYLGNPGVSILVFTEFQLTNIIGRQRCSRGQIAAYFEHAFWVVTPTVQSNGFQDVDPHFGVILVHSVVSILFFAAFVAVARLRKRVRMYFPLVPLGLVYLLFIGGTNSAWLSAVREDVGSAGSAAGSMILWVIFFSAVALTVWRVRSPRGLIFLRYHRGFLSSWLRGTHSPLQLRGKYSIMIDFWDEAVVQFSSPVHLAHLSFSSVVSAFSWNSVNACFPVLGLQLLWQVIVSCTIVFTLPGRSPFHNALLIVHSVAHVLILVAQLVALDCQKQRSYAVSEALVILTFALYVLSAVGQIAASFAERGYRAEAERELKDITAKHRRIVFFQDDLTQMAKIHAAENGALTSGAAATSSGAGVGGSSTTDYSVLSAATDELRLPSVKYRLVQPKLRDESEAIRRLHTKQFTLPHVHGTAGRAVDGDPWSIAGAHGGRHCSLGRNSPNAATAKGAQSRALWTRVEYPADNLEAHGDDTFFDAEAERDRGTRSLRRGVVRNSPPSDGLRREHSDEGGTAAIREPDEALSPLFSSPFASARGGGFPTTMRTARDRLSADSEWYVGRPLTMPPLSTQLLVNPGTTSGEEDAARKRATPPLRAGASPANDAVPHLPGRHRMPSSGTSGTTETVARCPGCSRWIVLEEGCVACGYRRGA